MRRKRGEKGQVMLVSVLTLGGVILIASTISGILMLYQLRQSSDITDSTKAIFAADAGIECELYNLNPANPDAPRNITCSDFEDSKTSVKTSVTYKDSIPLNIKSVGVSNRVNRAFLFYLEAPTSTP